MEKQSGIIFDIKRYALHDGPGIRTTVFLKGCHLRCKWCSNPESQQLQPEILFNKSKCTSCGKCIDVCPVGAHQNMNGEHTLNHSVCNNCGSCAEVCVYGAVKMTGREMSVDEVLDIVVRDMKYYEKSGGGMTLSGGDPLFQNSFSLALLKKAKQQGINTCIETAGFVNQEIMEKIIPYTDLILHDYKISDAAMHAKLTGVDNRKIRDNLDFLARNSVPVVLRCPVIPGINDNTDHFAAIAGLSKKYSNMLGVEIMPYHEFGKDKYEQTGRIYGIQSKPPSRDVSDNWVEQLRSMGCRNVIIG